MSENSTEVAKSDVQVAGEENGCSKTQVVGEIVVIAAILYTGHRIYRYAVRRAVRKSLEKK